MIWVFGAIALVLIVAAFVCVARLREEIASLKAQLHGAIALAARFEADRNAWEGRCGDLARNQLAAAQFAQVAMPVTEPAPTRHYRTDQTGLVVEQYDPALESAE